MSIQWFPGHIAKARREINEHISEVDIVIEIIDARCPLSSINFLNENINRKKRLIVLNKSDLADPNVLKKIDIDFIKQYVGNDVDLDIIFLDSRDNNIKKYVDKKINNLCDSIYKKNAAKGINNVLLKAIVVGMPNVGKSTFINSYVKRKINKVENTPGVTKKLQWTKISDKLLLLDTPGVTVKKFKNDDVGINLALVGSINDAIIEKQDIAYCFIDKCFVKYSDLFKKRYKLLKSDTNSKVIDIINEIAANNHFYKKGGDIDYLRTSNLIINDFRGGKIGKISLEFYD